MRYRSDVFKVFFEGIKKECENMYCVLCDVVNQIRSVRCLTSPEVSSLYRRSTATDKSTQISC